MNLNLCFKDNCDSFRIRRGKYCEEHRTNKKAKLKLRIIDIPKDIIQTEISSFLTIYENTQILFIIKDLNIDWSYLQKRDFPGCLLSPCRSIAINLDNGYLNEAVLDKDMLITKTDAMSKYKLNKKQILTLYPKLIKRNPYALNSGYPMCLYEIRDVQVLSAKLHFGLTNLKYYIAKQNEKKMLKKNSQEMWRKSLNYINQKFNKRFSQQSRELLLDIEFERNNMERRTDSFLCNSYIYGTMLTKSIEEIVAIMKLTSYLFDKGGHIYYTLYHEKFDTALWKTKYKYDHLSWYQCLDIIIH